MLMVWIFVGNETWPLSFEVPRAFSSFKELEELDMSHNLLGSPHEMSTHYLTYFKLKLKKVSIMNSNFIGFFWSVRQSVGLSAANTFRFPLFWCLWIVASVDHRSSYVFWKLWQTAFRFLFPFPPQIIMIGMSCWLTKYNWISDTTNHNLSSGKILY